MTEITGGARILHTRRFRKLFWQFVGQGPFDLKVVSPFLGGLPEFPSVVEFARWFLREEGRSLTLVTRPPRSEEDAISGIMTDTQAEAVVSLGVKLLIRVTPILHSKVYQLRLSDDRTISFVGSANFTIGGFSVNDETVAFLGGASENERVSKEISRLAGPGSTEYLEWKLLQKRVRL